MYIRIYVYTWFIISLLVPVLVCFIMHDWYGYEQMKDRMVNYNIQYGVYVVYMVYIWSVVCMCACSVYSECS